MNIISLCKQKSGCGGSHRSILGFPPQIKSLSYVKASRSHQSSHPHKKKNEQKNSVCRKCFSRTCHLSEREKEGTDHVSSSSPSHRGIMYILSDPNAPAVYTFFQSAIEQPSVSRREWVVAAVACQELQPSFTRQDVPLCPLCSSTSSRCSARASLACTFCEPPPPPKKVGAASRPL